MKTTHKTILEMVEGLEQHIRDEAIVFLEAGYPDNSDLNLATVLVLGALGASWRAHLVACSNLPLTPEGTKDQYMKFIEIFLQDNPALPSKSVH